MRKCWLAWVLIVTILVLSSCGKPEADVSVFLMPNSGIFNETVELLQEAVSERLGSAPTVVMYGSPVFSHQKLLVEVAAGQHDLFIVSESQLHAYASIGGVTPIDEYYDQEMFPEGYFSVEITERVDGEDVVVGTETHLYGIPLEHSKLFEELQLKGEGLFAFVSAHVRSMEDTIKVLDIFIHGRLEGR